MTRKVSQINTLQNPLQGESALLCLFHRRLPGVTGINIKIDADKSLLSQLTPL